MFLKHLTAAASQAWQPFVLIAGLLLVGLVANEDKIFEAVAFRIANLSPNTSVVFASSLALVACVTALLNLDTSVVFLTPILMHVARRRGVDEAGFLYGCVFMSNSASLLLPGSNLTNLLVLSTEHIGGGVFLARMWPAELAAVVVTGGVLLIIFKRSWTTTTGPAEMKHVKITGRLGWTAIGAATAAILLLKQPALPVLALGALTASIRLAQNRIEQRRVISFMNPALLAGLFGVAVGLGTLARAWPGPERLMAAASRWQTAAIGGVAAVAVNNLPAAVLLASKTPVHGRSLLLGLNLGPNLAVTGSLSAILWLQTVRNFGGKVSIRTYSKIGLALAPLSIVAALGAMAVLAPHGL